MPNPNGDIKIIEAVGEHIEKHIGKIGTVFHEKVSSGIHVDIFIVVPTADRPFQYLITSGMSELPMNTPQEAKDGRFAELAMCLPASWSLNSDAFRDENNYWPIRLLKMLAHYPHENETWLYAGHSLKGSGRPFGSNTKMTAALVRYPSLVPREGHLITIDQNRHACLWGIVPLYEEEYDFKQRNGFVSLNDLLVEHGVTELLDPVRINVAKLN